MLLLPLGVTTIPTNQKESRPVGILDWETVGKMLEAYGLGDILWRRDLVYGVRDAMLHHYRRQLYCPAAI